MKVLFCFISLLSTIHLIGQVDIHERWKVFNDSSQPDTIRVIAVEDIAWEYIYTDLDSALYFAKIELEFAQNMKNDAYLGEAYNTIGIIYADRGNIQPAIEHLLIALRLHEQHNSPIDVGAVKNNLGYIYTQAGEYEKAEKHIKDAMVLFSSMNDEGRLAESYINYAGCLRELDRFDESNDYYLKALEIAEKTEHIYMKSVIQVDLAANYDLMGKDKLALDWYDKALKTALEIDDIQGIGTIYNDLGIFYNKKGDYQKAVNYCQKSNAITKEINVHQAYYMSCYCLADAFEGLGQYDSALFYTKLEEDLEDSLLSSENIAEVTKLEMQFDFEKKKFADSLENVRRAEITELAHKAEMEKEEKQKLILYGGLGVAIFLGGFIFFRLHQSNKQKAIIERQKQEVDLAYEQLEEKNTEILDSITYAKRIQAAILPSSNVIKTYLKNAFIFYQPKDVVAGDFYWVAQTDDTVLLAAADCTGHGVPGAMVSVVCNNALNRAVREYSLQEPGLVLDKVRELVIEEFGKADEEVKDGMDIALVSLTREKKKEQRKKTLTDSLASQNSNSTLTLKYAGAHNPLWVIRKGASEVEEIKANKQPIGQFSDPVPFETHELILNEGDTFYLFSDGFYDQFGGEKGKKFKTANMKKLLLSLQSETLDEQHKLIEKAFEEWRGSLEQVDDVCVIGVRV